MTNISSIGTALFCAALGFAIIAYTQVPSQEDKTAQKEPLMTIHATGPFDVKLTPQKPDNTETEAANFARMSGDKHYHGDLEASARVEMLSTGNPKSSAVYVALERVTGTLQGRKGSFALYHIGIMTRGAPQLTIEVVPDSGTDQLAGLSGKMTINIAKDGKHSYDFDYSLPNAQ